MKLINLKTRENLTPANAPLLLFVSGFGFLPCAFESLKLPQNALSAMLYDYSDFSNAKNLQKILESFPQIHLIAWSMGVCVAQELFSSLQVKSALGINGTIFGVHKNFGISPKIFSLTQQKLQREAFLNSAFGGDLRDENMREKSLLAPIDSLKNELKNLQEFCAQRGENPRRSAFVWNKAIISDDDKIFPPKAQNLAWESYKQTHKDFVILHTNAPHFVFIDEKLWEEQCLPRSL
ncbi:hypothetical protein CQA49_00640 [Helicobacter sp. MIT 00-7814]|uniref:pimeloyl-ACP methyl esterase BioG family protein n=1 Tax=unclassified Helicobacter TaxID=2593540 RepID=UPI000E1F6526|nr:MULTISPECIES: pimeloyl-ACP methyl esterase BioG family protein [unclassified Helicobacter]RDU57203.1 hypothetical protein CQA49_00640 [Helicobacter sp. MIT 00-7814]RDU57755.1 hypothetical protein CQA37_00640 [Helicobacter sp. MIT 99-10781]